MAAKPSVNVSRNVLNRENLIFINGNDAQKQKELLDGSRTTHCHRNGPLIEILLWNRIIRRFGLPVDTDHPPAFPVIHQLKAVDPAHERIFVVLISKSDVR